MAAISIPVPEEQENPPGNPDLKICTNKNCMLCNEDGSDEFNLGKLYEFKGIVAHYYCLLLSSNMQQRGDDTEGIFGFLPVDIRKEIARGRNLRCYYCKMKGATIGCCSNRCKRVFHLPCGRKKDSLHQFFAEFRSYCGDHRPLLNVKNLEIPHDSVCNICLEVFKPKPSKSTIHSLLAFCCKKWFHRVCIQRCALNSGYFFKCPMCNNKTLFQRVMQDHGIFIPEQDAAWELEPGAYRELLDRHNQCDARVCVCPKGRNFNSAGTRWAVVLCSSCGSQGMHVRCGKLGFRSPAWECPVCVSAHSQHGQPAHGVDAAQSNSEAIIEIEDSDDDDVQLISVSMGNQDTESAIVCIDDEEGSPLQLIKSDTLLATPGGGAISVMTIAASDKIQEVVGDLNVVHQRRMPDPSQPTQPSQPSQPSQHSQPTQPSQPSLKIVSVVGGVQISDDDDDDDSDVVVESGPSELPGSRSAAGSPPCKRLRTAGTPPVPHAAAPPVSLSLGITSQMQNMIIVSPASSSQGQQPHPEQLPASPSQQPVAGKNQNQMGHISFPVPGMDRAGGVINLQVMFPPGGMINLVQTPFPANSSQMPQVPTFQLFQGMFPNTSLPVSPQMSPSVPVSSALASTVSSPVSKEVPRSSLLSQQTCSITTTSSPQTASETTVSAPEPSPLPAEKTRQASSSPAPAQAADDDVQFVSEYPSDISTRMLLTPDRDSPLRRLPHSAPESDAGTDVASRNTPDQSDVCGEQSFQPQGCALGQCINTNRNIRLVQNDASPGTSSSPYIYLNSGAPAVDRSVGQRGGASWQTKAILQRHLASQRPPPPRAPPAASVAAPPATGHLGSKVLEIIELN
ncbi:pineapple eye protein-like isoform X2 [Bacillus rossius redtenbacheri]|uniref:pineapple eye protein-like isoform X2 n=1 Tax=Bacillus rossius redtenbacheri TaxID=93214 RepID=UPI002FDED8ED